MARLVWVANNTHQAWESLLTVTYPETWPTDQRESKEHLRMLIQSIGRKYKGTKYLWVREFQSRGAPHYHLLLSTPIRGRFRKYRKPAGCKGPAPSGSVEQHTWVSFEWQRLIGNYGSEKGLRAGCRWEKLRSKRGGAAYLATYFGKEEQKQIPPGVESPGRWWGHSQSVGDIEPDYAIEVPAARYFREVEGNKTSKDGWLFATLHNGRKRCASFLSDQQGGTLSARGRVLRVVTTAKLPPFRGGVSPGCTLAHAVPVEAPRLVTTGRECDDDPESG